MAKRDLSKLKVAIVHDWLYGGGAEKVVLELHHLFPDAPIFTSYCSHDWRRKLDNKVVTGYLQHWPFNKLRKFLPVLRMHWFSHLDLSGYDLVISSSGNGEAMGVRVPESTLHISYCHTPTHYYWRHYEQYLAQPGFGMFNPIARLGLKLLVTPLRRWDYRAAQGPDYLIANSTSIQTDIKQYYGRDSVVIYPPVDISRFAAAPLDIKRQGFVVAGRQVPAKRNDLAVQACTRLNLALKVIGRGPDVARLRKLAGPTVQFLTDVSDEQMPLELASAQAMIFCSYEDFGITPVEALATGTPLIAYRAGGALDYVQEGKNGLFFDEQNVESVSLALALLPLKGVKFSPAQIRETAQVFSPELFQKAIRSFVQKCLAARQK